MKNTILSLCLVLFFSAISYSQTAFVISEKANLRGTPTTKGKVVDTLSRQTNLEVIKQKGVWFLVQTSDYVGWIHGNTIKIPDPNSLISEGSLVSQPKAKKATRRKKRSRTTPRPRVRKSRRYIRGSRGGCYYINRNGNKTYVSRSLCR